MNALGVFRLIALSWCCATVLAIPMSDMPQAHMHDADGSIPWLDQWGETIQIISGIVLFLGITVLVVLRLAKLKSPNAASTYPAEGPSGQDPNSGNRTGLTLVELLVVLLILAVLTTVAIQSITGSVDQSRYDASQRTLQNIQDAIIGPANQRAPDGSQLFTGFVADIGRLPQPVYQNNLLVGDPLCELWDFLAIAANSGVAYNIQSTKVPTTGQNPLALLNSLNNPLIVTMSCGWRGPYLQLPIGSNNTTTGYPALLDGWGNQFRSLYQVPLSSLFPTTPQPTTGNTPAQPINVVCSLGADNAFDLALPSNPYNIDQYVPVQLGAPPLAPLASFSDRVYGTITVTVQSINNTVQPVALTNPFPIPTATATPANPAYVETQPTVRVVLFTPVNGTLTTFILDSSTNTIINTNPTPATYLNNPNPNPVDFSLPQGVPPTWPPPTTKSVTGSFYNVPIGPRAIQAFQYDAAPGTNNMVITKRSPLIFLSVPASSVATTLILQ